jgi:pimeloyl-ACP methyl ester carboxylesterase
MPDTGGALSSPETKYALSGDVNIAYQVMGEGPLDLVFVMGWVSHLDYYWEQPLFARFLRRLASFSRLILFDKRGTGLSDRVALHELPTLEQRMDDVRAVMDAVGSERAALMGVSEGGPMCLLFAATYPERTAALVLNGAYAKRLWAEDYPFGERTEVYEAFLEDIRENWGGPVGLERRAPSLIDDEHFRNWWATYLRMSASPGAAYALTRMNSEIDVRHALSVINVPTLIIHRTGDRSLPIEGARYMAERIPRAELIELSGDDHLPFVGEQDEILDDVEEFLTGIRRPPAPARVLTTVLFTDIVGSTERAVALGDRRWRDLLEMHNAAIRRELALYRGEEIDTAGDGFFASGFDGPARAIRCGCAIRDAVASLSLGIRVGVHTGECDVVDGKLSGLAVVIGARVAAQAEPGEVLVSGTVRDLVAGSGIEFEPRGRKELKGLGEWPVFAVATVPRS